LSVLAARRRLRLGDLEDDEDERRAAPAPAPDNSLFIGRIERVEHQVGPTFCLRGGRCDYFMLLLRVVYDSFSPHKIVCTI
jgi:hypothetical protein